MSEPVRSRPSEGLASNATQCSESGTGHSNRARSLKFRMRRAASKRVSYDRQMQEARVVNGIFLPQVAGKTLPTDRINLHVSNSNTRS
jgi:hypothetical protein